MSNAQREMTLDEWVDRLPPDHTARGELSALLYQISAHKAETARLTAELAMVEKERDETRAAARDTDRWRVKAECYGAMVHGVTPALEVSGHKEVPGASGIVSLHALADEVVSDLIKTRKERDAALTRAKSAEDRANALAAAAMEIVNPDVTVGGVWMKHPVRIEALAELRRLALTPPGDAGKGGG